MDEAKKTNRLRGPEFASRYLGGKVIDIGAGRDLVCAWAERFDLEDGDANHITRFRPANTYDAVHSSHCLEHMHKPPEALAEWWALLKTGGHLVLVVPDEDLYEQGFWPSRFNEDHKATFTLKKDKSWSPVSYNIVDLVTSLPGVEVLSVQTQDEHYDHRLQTRYPPAPVRKPPLATRVVHRLLEEIHPVGEKLLHGLENRMLARHHVPVDQTRRDALAQIQVVARKT